MTQAPHRLTWADHQFIAACGWIAMSAFFDRARADMMRDVASEVLPKVTLANPHVTQMSIAFQTLCRAPYGSAGYEVRRLNLARAYARYLEERVGQAQDERRKAVLRKGGGHDISR